MLVLAAGCDRSIETQQPRAPIAAPVKSISPAALPTPVPPIGSDRAETTPHTAGPGQRMGITSPCVLHAGDSYSRRRERLTPSGAGGMLEVEARCWFNAECVVQQGHPSPGDGLVGLECKNQSCTCSFKSSNPVRRSSSFSFRTATPCSTTEVAEDLLRTYCMIGMVLDQPDAGNSDVRIHKQ